MNRLELAGCKLAICLGPGGVGKTTISAALAIDGACNGRAVDVMTVDPAPRLLDALGLNADASEPREVALDSIALAAGAARRGRLRALRLDPRSTFDAIVRRYAATPAAAEAIISGRIYANLASAFAGVADYMAMEKLLELAAEPTADFIVLDTPPAAEALDFLDAPRRLLELLGSRAVSLLGTRQGRFGSGVVDLAARAVLSAFDRVTGLKLLGDVQAFVRNFEGMYEGFAERASRARAMLHAESTAVIVVTTAEAGRIAQAGEFIAALRKAELRVRAVIVNRAMADLPNVAEISRAKMPAALKRKLKRNLADYAALKTREAISFETLRAAMPAGAALMLSSELEHEPRTLADLAQIGARIHRGQEPMPLRSE
ncbi:MAG TPA: ArsA-related P-loop ATPase [Candidatus Binataceae bacterium]|nr:ArsA-related P-loop ATPase [Candidatus Binataceae bacterium]